VRITDAKVLFIQQYAVCTEFTMVYECRKILKAPIPFFS